MGAEDYQKLYDSLRPEIKSLIESDRAYWQERYNDIIGEVQEYVYNLYLKYNRVKGGTKNYSEVVGLIIAYEHQSTK